MKKQYHSPSIMVHDMQAVTMQGNSVHSNNGVKSGGKYTSTKGARGRAYYWDEEDDDDFDF